jgi:hypothetical protein
MNSEPEQIEVVWQRKYYWWQKSGALAIFLVSLSVFWVIFGLYFDFWSVKAIIIPMVFCIYGACFSCGMLRKFAWIIFFQLGVFLVSDNLFLTVINFLLLLVSNFFGILFALNTFVCDPWCSVEGHKIKRSETPPEEDPSSAGEAAGK